MRLRLVRGSKNAFGVKEDIIERTRDYKKGDGMKGKNAFRRTKTVIYDKIKEAFSSVMPITAIVLILCATVTPMESGVFLAFVLGALLTVVGIGLFTLGADTAMTPIGEYVGSTVMRSKKIWLIVPVFFIVGVLITVSEPDLQVLAGQLSETINNRVLILTVGAGVGVFLVVAFLRILLKIKMKYVLLVLYTAVFALAFFVPESFVPVAFDSGGVTTGPMSVPFIIAIGTGIAAMRNDGGAEEDGFGLTALCSIGPILAVMILGLIYQPENFRVTETEVIHISNSRELFAEFLKQIPHYMKEVGIALLPIACFYFVFRLFGAKNDKRSTVKIVIGLIYTYVGLVLFLLGVNVGFLQAGNFIGKEIGELSYNWIIVPIGFLIGFFVVAAEPAVHVLTKQVYEITAGAVPKKALSVSLMIGVGASVALAMLRILLHIPIMYFLIPTYVISLALAFVVPDIFTAVAFDSGGVASGAMTSGFVLPLALGLCRAVGGNVATEGFGVVAFVAMTPLITIQILGLVYKLKKRAAEKRAEKENESEEIIG